VAGQFIVGSAGKAAHGNTPGVARASAAHQSTTCTAIQTSDQGRIQVGIEIRNGAIDSAAHVQAA
jgi:hypothetical protein